MKGIGLAFDLEGTLVDLEKAHHGGHLETARELGLTLSFEDALKLIPSLVGGPDFAVAAEIKKAADAQDSVEEIVSRTRRHYRRLRAAMDICPRRGVAAFLLSARQMNIPLAIGSVTSREDGNAILSAAGLLSFFPQHAQVFIEDVVQPKPAPDVYVETANRMGVAVSHQLVFEDSPVGVRAAIAANSRVIAIPAVTDFNILDHFRRCGALAVFSDWTDFSIESIIKLWNPMV